MCNAQFSYLYFRMETLTIDRSKLWTVANYALLGENKTPCQLIEGELFMSPTPTPLHQKVSRELFRQIDRAIKNAGELFYAPIDLYIDEKNVFQPDLVYLSADHVASITERGIEGPVDLIIEIISPSSIFSDRNQKKKKYIAFGVREYWIVDPANRTLEVYTPEAGEDLPILFLSGSGQVKSSVISSLEFQLQEIF